MKKYLLVLVAVTLFLISCDQRTSFPEEVAIPEIQCMSASKTDDSGMAITTLVDDCVESEDVITSQGNLTPVVCPAISSNVDYRGGLLPNVTTVDVLGDLNNDTYNKRLTAAFAADKGQGSKICWTKIEYKAVKPTLGTVSVLGYLYQTLCAPCNTKQYAVMVKADILTSPSGRPTFFNKSYLMQTDSWMEVGDAKRTLISLDYKTGGLMKTVHVTKNFKKVFDYPKVGPWSGSSSLNNMVNFAPVKSGLNISVVNGPADFNLDTLATGTTGAANIPNAPLISLKGVFDGGITVQTIDVTCTNGQIKEVCIIQPPLLYPATPPSGTDSGTCQKQNCGPFVEEARQNLGDATKSGVTTAVLLFATPVSGPMTYVVGGGVVLFGVDTAREMVNTVAEVGKYYKCRGQNKNCNP